MPLFCHYLFAWFWLWTSLDQYPIVTGSWTITDQQRRLIARKTFPCKEFLYMFIQESKLAKTYHLRFCSKPFLQPLQLYRKKATYQQKPATWGILIKPLDCVSFDADTKWFVYTLWSGKLSQWCLTCCCGSGCSLEHLTSKFLLLQFSQCLPDLKSCDQLSITYPGV